MFGDRILPSVLSLVLPPVAGAIIGYFTNDVAIKMLFRPYRPLFVGGWQIPFTPGLIPRNQNRLAQRIADTIMQSLLTPEELQTLAQRLLETKRVAGAIRWLLHLSLEQIQHDREQKTAQILAHILRDLFQESLPRLLRVWSKRQDFLAAQIDQIFDRVLLEYQLTDRQARQLSDWLLDTALPPNRLRRFLIDNLTDRHIDIIDETFREKSSGTYWLIANLFGLKNTLLRLRVFCGEEVEITNARIQELVIAMDVRARLRRWLQSLSLQNLPLVTVRQLRRTVRETVVNYLQENGAALMASLGETVDWDRTAVLIINRLQASTVLATSLDAVSVELALVLERYLEADLEALVAQAIPILAIDQLIIDRVNATSPGDLEGAIQGIVRSELQGIVDLGGILGLLVGLVQSLFLWWQS